MDPHKPKLWHHQATLQQFYQMTTTLSTKDCPPVNAIALPSYQRNLYVSSQLGSVAFHEVAQSCLPSRYPTAFKVPDIRPHTEWSLIRGKALSAHFTWTPKALGQLWLFWRGANIGLLLLNLENMRTDALLTLLGLNGTLTLLMMGMISTILALRQSTSKRVTHCVKASVQTSLYKVHKFESVQRVPKVLSKCLYWLYQR